MHVFLTEKTNCALRLVEKRKKERDRVIENEREREKGRSTKYRKMGERDGSKKRANVDKERKREAST